MCHRRGVGYPSAPSWPVCVPPLLVRIVRFVFLSWPVVELLLFDVPVVPPLALVPVPGLLESLEPLPPGVPLVLPVEWEFPVTALEDLGVPVFVELWLDPLPPESESPLPSTPSEPLPLAETSLVLFEVTFFLVFEVFFFVAASAPSTNPKESPKAPKVAPAATPRRSKSHRLRRSAVTVVPLPTETAAQTTEYPRSHLQGTMRCMMTQVF